MAGLPVSFVSSVPCLTRGKRDEPQGNEEVFCQMNERQGDASGESSVQAVSFDWALWLGSMCCCGPRRNWP